MEQYKLIILIELNSILYLYAYLFESGGPWFSMPAGLVWSGQPWYLRMLINQMKKEFFPYGKTRVPDTSLEIELSAMTTIRV